jgi:hypothetical protein
MGIASACMKVANGWHALLHCHHRELDPRAVVPFELPLGRGLGHGAALRDPRGNRPLQRADRVPARLLPVGAGHSEFRECSAGRPLRAVGGWLDI